MEPMNYLLTIDQVRAAEQPLLEAQSREDELMQSAAAAVADHCARIATNERYLLLVGPGGNGGDALYAGAITAMRGVRVEAWAVLGRESLHERAAQTFANAGGTFVEAPSGEYGLVVDGIFGLGGRGAVPQAVADFLSPLYRDATTPILSIDLPSGLSGDTGHGEGEHVQADVTVTFGSLRRAHGLTAKCGQVVVEDIALGDGSTLSEQVVAIAESAAQQGRPLPRLLRAPVEWVEKPQVETALVGESELHRLLRRLPSQPTPTDNKYSGGVVGIHAGSSEYPGAGVLSCAGAVRTTSSMVRYIGANAATITRAFPEVVVHPDRFQAGRVQARVVGPGRGTDRTAREELADLMDTVQPLALDADAMTLCAKHPALLKALRQRTTPSVLTPHAGEFTRLAEALTDAGHAIPDVQEHRIEAVEAMAEALGATVLLKGRFTVIAEAGGGTVVVDYASSWAATAGSGDVLSGILGALLARNSSEILETASLAGIIHAVAARISAETGWGVAPSHATKIEEAIRPAIALLTSSRSQDE